MMEIIKAMRKNAKLPKILGTRIAKHRKKLGVSQEYIADKAGISRVYMGYIEQGRNVPSLAVLQKISKLLKVTMSDFF